MHNSNDLFYNRYIHRYKGPFLIDLLQTSVNQVFRDHFAMQPKPCKTRPKGVGYVATIPFSDRQGEKVASVWIQRATLEKIAALLLFEEDPDEATLEDLAAEVANFIVGHAKMEASEKGLACSMGTPGFEGVRPLDEAAHTHLYKIGGRCMALQTKEPDAQP